MSEEKQIDYKEFARQMRQVATVFNGTEPAVVCSKELWESIASTIESFAGYRKQSEWISVEERLPEKGIEVLVALKIGDRVSVDTDRIYFGKWLNYGKFGCACEKGYVTHWLPLPEAPKMKGGAE